MARHENAPRFNHRPNLGPAKHIINHPRHILRALPLLGGPLLHLGFSVLTVPPAQVTRLIAQHVGIALAAALLAPNLFAGWLGLDSVIALSYCAYAAAILLLWRKGQNTLCHARLEMTATLHRWMLWAGGFLLAMVLIDTAIAASFALHRSDEAVKIISFGASPKLQTAVVVPPDEAAALEGAAHAFLISTQLYLDPALSIDRLAKRLYVPMRSLSAAINQSKGMNVSQYVNGFRLSHAAGLLQETQLSVTKIAAQAGFLSRSNFYREFQRCYDQSPAAYRQSQSDYGRGHLVRVRGLIFGYQKKGY